KLRSDAMEPGALIHGWQGLFAAYAAVEAPLLAGMLQAHARWRRLALAPALGAPLTALSGAAIAALTPALERLGITSESLLQLSTGVALSAAIGYLSGRALGRERAPGNVHLRGAIVSAPEARPPAGIGRGVARTRERTRAALTLAGVALAPE